jgi:hypothetical protein
MILQVRINGRLRLKALAFALGTWVLSASSAVSGDGESEGKCQLCGKAHHGAGGPGYGTLGYGPPGVFPGYQGFSLKYHLGYGYGRKALGVGAFGGDPFYGGPGYPHPWPHLNRLCGITPFPHYGGPGYLGLPYCNFFGEPGQLVINEDVADEGDRRDQAALDGYGYGIGFAGSSDYGMFSGAIPYPESYFAPNTAAAAAMGSATPLSSAPAPASRITTAREFGIDEELTVDAKGVGGMKVIAVYPGTLAQQAGFQAGDIIRSLNHYLTIQPGDLGWIIANATPGSDLTLYVRKLSDRKSHAVTVRLP